MRTSALARRDPEKSAMAMDYQPAELENYPGYHIRRLQQIAVAIFLQETDGFGVTPIQYGVLLTVNRQPGLDQRTLAGSIALDTSTTGSLLDRLELALTRAGPFPALVVAGGVAANQTVRAALEAFADRHAMRFTAPPLALCTDNAAMIAWAGCERLALAGADFTGDSLDFVARPRWPLDPEAEAVRGAGVKA